MRPASTMDIVEEIRNDREKGARRLEAELCGFGSDAYLKKLFRNRLGCTMRDWRHRGATTMRTPFPKAPSP